MRQPETMKLINHAACPSASGPADRQNQKLWRQEMAEEVTLKELKDMVENMKENTVLSITFAVEEDGDGAEKGNERPGGSSS